MSRNHPSDPLILSVAQAADRFKVHPETVLRWAKTGRLKGFRSPGGRWRFRAEDIDAWLEPESAS